MHLCGSWYRLVGNNHLRMKHGWTLEAYRDAFGLLASEPTCARGTSQKLRQVTTGRLKAGELEPGRGHRKPIGSGGRTVRRGQSLGALRPDLVQELDPSRNAEVDPFKIGVKSGRKLWWRCGGCAHVWQAAPHNRSRGRGCRACAVQHRVETNSHASGECSLSSMRPDLVAELHPARNAGVDLTLPRRAVGEASVARFR